MPKRDICRHLRRSAKSVECAAYRLRKQGIPVDLRCYTPRAMTCPACGSMSARMGREGICEPCRRRGQLAVIHARIADLLQRLPIEERDTYGQTEAETESARDAMPKAPDTRGLSYYARAKAEEAHAIACEQVAIANLKREIKAAQKRKERIEKKAKSMRVRA